MIQYSLYLLTTTIVKNAGKIRIIFSKSLTLTVWSYADYMILFDLNGMEKLYFDYRSIFKIIGSFLKILELIQKPSSGSSYDSCVYVIVVTFLWNSSNIFKNDENFW